MTVSGPAAVPPSVPEPSLTRQALVGGSWLSLSAVFQVVIQFVAVGVLARLLTPAEFGIVAAAMVVVELAQSLAQLGMRPAVVQRAEMSDALVRVAFTLSMAISAVFALLTYGFAGPLSLALGVPESRPLLQALSLVFLIQGFGTIAEALAARRKQFGLLAIRRLASYLIGYGVVGIGCALLDQGAWSLVYAKLAETTCSTLLLSLGAPHPRRPLVKGAGLRQLLNFGAGQSVGQIANALANQADFFLVARLMGTSALGLYSRSYQIMRLPSQLLGNVVQDVAFPSFTALQNEPHRMARGLYRALLLMNMALYPAAGACAILAPEIIALALGPQWSAAALLLSLFAFAIPFRSSQRLFSTVATATGSTWGVAARQAIYFVLVGAGAWLGSGYGLAGVVIGVSLAILAQAAMQAHAAMQVIGISLRQIWQAHWRPVPLTVAFVAPLWLATVLARSGGLPAWGVVVTAAFAAAAFALSVVVLAPRLILTVEGLELLSAIAKKLPGPAERLVIRVIARR